MPIGLQSRHPCYGEVVTEDSTRDALRAFVAARDWGQFHSPENLAKSIAIEAGELLECFQWNSDADADRVQDELADVLTYCFLLADRLGVAPEQIILEKLARTDRKYPVERAKGRKAEARSMTDFEIERLRFDRGDITTWGAADRRHLNWPVVYTLNNERDIYVGESKNATARMRQHLDSPTKAGLQSIRVVIDDRFNKSVCLDLESFLIELFAGDGKYRMLNGNAGITNAEYFDRGRYQGTFDRVFDELLHEGLFTRTIAQIRNSDLFKLSPFKALTHDQAIATEDILEGLLADVASGRDSTSVIQGEPGTGKTIVAIYLMKLIRDIGSGPAREDLDHDSMFSEFFMEGYRETLAGLRIGLVIPQQSLRTSVQKVFGKTPGLDKNMVLTPFEVGESEDLFDLLIVDETHRLNQRANQPSGVQNKRFADITAQLFGNDDYTHTQLDWIRAQSKHQIFLLDSAQSVRPADLPASAQRDLVTKAETNGRRYRLTSQMRVRAGQDYIQYIRDALSPNPPTPQVFSGYDLRLFDDLDEMQREIRKRDSESGLARLVAGYAWKWKSKTAPAEYDIEIAGCQLRWNRTDRDWINSPGSLEEVGSIHTVQGYDLNYAAVIIGNDLRYDPIRGRLFFDRANYFDTKGKENNPRLGVVYSDDDLLTFITNIYGVLLTRGILGTYVYVCDPALREHLRPLFAGERSGGDLASEVAR